MTTKKEARTDTIAVRDGRLLIDVALGPGEVSMSGKSKVYFTTHGNVAIDGGYKLGLTLYKPERGSHA